MKSCLFTPEKIKLYCSAEKNVGALSSIESCCGPEKCRFKAGQVGCPVVMAFVSCQGNPPKCAA